MIKCREIHLTGTRGVITTIQGAEAAAGGAGQVLRCGHAASAAADAAAAAHEHDDAGDGGEGLAGAVFLTPMAPSRVGRGVAVCACGGRRGPQQSQAQGGVHDCLSLRLTNNTSTRRTAAAAAAAAAPPRFLPLLPPTPSTWVPPARRSLTHWAAALHQVLHIIGTTATECVSLPFTREGTYACLSSAPCASAVSLLPPFSAVAGASHRAPSHCACTHHLSAGGWR
eukprot:COSAG01_NODE_5103_length_4481_cov_13.715883_9_plen_226_part_00